MFGRTMVFLSPNGCSCGCNTLCARTPTVITGVAEDITNTSATIADNRLFDFRHVDRAGVMFSTTRDFAMSGQAFGPSVSPFSVELTGLEPNTTYFYRAFACADCSLTFGEIRTFSTGGQPVGQVTTGVAIDITATSAVIEDNSFNGMICDTLSQGVQFSQSPDMTSPRTANGATGSPFTVILNGLSPSTTYYYRAFVTCDGATTYGSIRTFTTLEATGGMLVTGVATNVTGSTATIANNTFSGFSTPITAVGVQYSTNANMSNARTAVTAAVNPFSLNLTGLLPNTVYYFRAFLTTNGMTRVGQVRSVTTGSNPPGIIVTTGEAANVNRHNVNIINNRYSFVSTPVTSQGVQISTQPNMSNFTRVTTSVANPFNALISNLAAGTVYYFRAFIVTGGSTFVGSTKSFRTQF